MFHFICLSLFIRKLDITEPIFETLVQFFQQGLEPIQNYFSRKIWVLTIGVSFLIIYNLYTSSVLSEILKSSSKIPSTIEEFIESPLQLYFEDMPYVRKYFQIHSMNKTIKQLVTKNQNETVPIFHKRDSVAKLLKKEKTAFFCERMIAYALLKKQLMPEEVCELRESGTFFVNDNLFLELLVQRESQYIELFRYGMIKAVEFGINKRELLTYRIRKPVCQTINPVKVVNIIQVKSAFKFFGIAFYASFVVLVFEKFAQRLIYWRPFIIQHLDSSQVCT